MGVGYPAIDRRFHRLPMMTEDKLWQASGLLGQDLIIRKAHS